MSNLNQQDVLFERLSSKPVRVTFGAEALTSDAGMMLLASADKKLGLTRAICDQIHDGRQAGKTDRD